jgi:hypothetical protein
LSSVAPLSLVGRRLRRCYAKSFACRTVWSEAQSLILREWDKLPSTERWVVFLSVSLFRFIRCSSFGSWFGMHDCAPEAEVHRKCSRWWLTVLIDYSLFFYHLLALFLVRGGTKDYTSLIDRVENQSLPTIECIVWQTHLCHQTMMESSRASPRFGSQETNINNAINNNVEVYTSSQYNDTDSSHHRSGWRHGKISSV